MRKGGREPTNLDGFHPKSPATFDEAVGLVDLVNGDAHHGFAQAAGGLGDDVGYCRSALTGLPDSKMSVPTNTPSAPSYITMAASAGVAKPPAVNRGACRLRRLP
jgi:hypothetical protein